jgi:hypothetical protein
LSFDLKSRQWRLFLWILGQMMLILKSLGWILKADRKVLVVKMMVVILMMKPQLLDQGW